MSHKARIRSGHVYVINVVQLSIQIEINRKQLIYMQQISTRPISSVSLNCLSNILITIDLNLYNVLYLKVSFSNFGTMFTSIHHFLNAFKQNCNVSNNPVYLYKEHTMPSNLPNNGIRPPLSPTYISKWACKYCTCNW